MRIRTFIAVTASSAIRHSAVKLMGLLGPVCGDVKWVAPENLHWTLQFLGEVEQLEIHSVCNAVAMAAEEIDPFNLEARGAGAFPAPDRPKTLWIGAGVGAQTMVVLHDAIERRLLRLGHRSEHRRFVPHLTLGRVGRETATRPIVRELAGLSEYDAGSMLVDEVTVFASKLTSDGPQYEVLSRAPLAG